MGAWTVAVHAWDLLREVTIIFITSTIVWPQVNSREGTELHQSTENWIKDLLSMAPPIRIRPSTPSVNLSHLSIPIYPNLPMEASISLLPGLIVGRHFTLQATREAKTNKKMPTAPAIPRQSPIQVLTGPTWLSSRDHTRSGAFRVVWL